MMNVSKQNRKWKKRSIKPRNPYVEGMRQIGARTFSNKKKIIPRKRKYKDET